MYGQNGMEGLILMVKKERLLLTRTTVIAKDTVEMVLKNKNISMKAKPGQFIHISIPHFTLRRPISIASVDRTNETITLIFKILGKGTKQLAQYEEGMTLDALGPTGSSFDLTPPQDAPVLLIGGGVGVPPLHYLGQVLASKGIEVISVLGYQTAESVFYEEEFNKFGKTYIVTNDGTKGEEGFVTDLLDQIDGYSQYYSCGPLPMLQAVTQKLEDKPGYISLEERMGCGIGACFACVIPTAKEGSYRKICQDGPVFSAKEVVL